MTPALDVPAGGDERFRALFERASSGVALSTLDGTFVEVNAGLRELLAGTGVGAPGDGLADLTRHLPEGSDEARAWRGALEDVRTGRRPVARAELPIAPPDAPPRWLRVTAAVVVLGERRCLLSHVEDTTERRPAEQGVAQLPLRDGLTGLADRALLADRLALARVEDATSGLCTGLLRVDLHDFTQVNVVLGRDGGDAVLVAIAGRLSGLVRVDDTVARIGGVAFAVLARDLPDPAALAGLAGRLARALADPLDVGTARLRIGVAVAGDLVRAADSFATALLRAEQALSVVRRESRRAAEVDLRETDLRETDLRGTDLRGTDLRGTDLRGTDPPESDPRPGDPLGGDPHGVTGGCEAEARGGERRETDQRPA